MKVIGTVLVTSRLQQGTVTLRAQQALLKIGKHPSTQELCLSYHTTQNKAGVIYKIRGNIENMFLRCINDGKATIRFLTPAHDMSINCEDKLQLKLFLQTLNKICANKSPLADTLLSTLNQTTVAIPKAKTILKIKQKHEYPLLNGFPRTLQQLYINDIEVKIFDTKILRLQNLKILNLSDNLLTTLPEALGDLPALHTLVLKNNRLGKSTDQDANWPWLNNRHLATTLAMLDLRNNEILELPKNLCNLQALAHLDVSCNSLETLFPGIGRLKALRVLRASENKIKTLPSSIRTLRLEAVDVSHNPWNVDDPLLSSRPEPVPTLGELAARVIVNKRMELRIGRLPKRLANYLYEANFCRCGSACFECSARAAQRFHLRDIAEIVTNDFGGYTSSCVIETYYCSLYCYRTQILHF